VYVGVTREEIPPEAAQGWPQPRRRGHDSYRIPVGEIYERMLLRGSRRPWDGVGPIG
jgi:hypothetical protein